MATRDEHVPTLGQSATPASKSQQQSWAQDLLDTIKTNRLDTIGTNRRPTAWAIPTTLPKRS